MEHRHYRDLLRAARRLSRRPDEAEDLLQATLLVAVEAGRATATRENQRWMAGVLRHQAALAARGAIRARHRETAWQRCQAPAETGAQSDPSQRVAIGQLPRSLRIVLLLALSGHTRGEIRHLLGLSDQALRQRVSQLRRCWAQLVASGVVTSGEVEASTQHSAHGPLPYGTVRSALLPMVRRVGPELATHDPDGHLFAIGAHKTWTVGNSASIEPARRKP